MSQTNYQRRFVFIITCGILSMCLYLTRNMITKDMILTMLPLKGQGLSHVNKTSAMFSVTEQGMSHVNKTNNRLTILLYNQVLYIPFHIMGDALASCPYKNCIFTANRSDLGRHAAIIYVLTAAPKLPVKPPITPADRRLDQIWIFAWLESPIHHFFAPRNIYMNKFWRTTVNWTMTYTYSADIFLPYGVMTTRDTVPKRNYTAMFYSKTRMAAWIVSHCGTESKREVYVEQMKKHGVQVDIFGRCSGKRKGNEYLGNEYLVNEINKKYKFYLAFENSLCEDYISEKFFSRFDLDTIIVARGGGNYSKIVENNAYINTANYKSAKELAAFMLSVASNVTLFTQYMESKSKYTNVDIMTINMNAACQICSKLNNLDQNRKTYPDIKGTVHNNTCADPRDIIH